MPCEIGRAGEGALGKFAELAADQPAVGRLADADGAVHALGNQVDQAVALADMELDVGVALQEARQAGKQEVLGEPAVDVDPQRPDRRRPGGGRVRVVDRRQDRQATPVVVLPLRRQRHLAGGTRQQADTEVALELLDRL